MKKTLLVIGLLISINFSLFSVAPDSLKPMPLPASEFKFPSYTYETLSNGLKLFYIEDSEQPVVNFSIMISGGSSVDGTKPGLASITAALLTKGAGEFKAKDIAEKLDGIGASISADASNDMITIYGTCLKKHLETFLVVMKEVLLNPTFPGDEFDKIIPQMVTGLQQEKASSIMLARNLTRKILYGNKHPYGMKPTEKSLKDIEVEDVRNYYKSFFKPNAASLAVSGDITKKEFKNLADKYFGSWQKGVVPKIVISPIKPEIQGVYFIARPSSVQSTVIVATRAIPATSAEYEVLGLASDVIGAGFAGRLFRTLREKYSYTYTPFGNVSDNKYANIFACGAEVRNSVTDSAITVINEQLANLSNSMPPDSELNRVKNFEVGNYLMSFENSNHVLSLIQEADFYGIPIQRVKEYHEALMSFNSSQIRDIARKYMNPQNAYIIVVGSPEVKSKLDKFGKIFEYNNNLEALTGEKGKFEKVSLNPEELLEKYTEAIGGKQVLDSVQTLIDSGEVKLEIRGMNFNGKVVEMAKSPNKKYTLLDLGFQKQETWCDGTNAWNSSGAAAKKEEGDNLEDIITDATMFQYTKLPSLGYKCEVLGKQEGSIILKAVSPKDQENIFYFDPQSFLLTKLEQTKDTPQGPIPSTIEFSDYITVNGIKLPKTIKSTNPMFTMSMDFRYIINQPLDDSLFAPKK
jgi:zinc protease